MIKIIDYRIVGEPTPYDMANAVKSLMSAGWQPWGGLVANTAGDGEEFLWQAMVIYE